LLVEIFGMKLVTTLFLALTLAQLASAVPSQSQEQDCRNNLVQIGEALSEYSRKNGGETGAYPRSLDELALPIRRCPSGPEYSYSNDILSPGNDAGFQAFYLLKCEHHRHLGFTRDRGIVDPTRMKIPIWAEDFVRRGIERRKRTR